MVHTHDHNRFEASILRWHWRLMSEILHVTADSVDDPDACM